MGVSVVIEMAEEKKWKKLWLECDSMMVVQAFKNMSIVPWKPRNICSGQGYAKISMKKIEPNWFSNWFEIELILENQF